MNCEMDTHIDDKICEGFEALGSVVTLVELLPVFDQEQRQRLLLLGDLQSEVHLLHLFRRAEESRKDRHWFGRKISGVVEDSLHLLNVAIRRQT